jgi:lipopolysaccharide export LptBFGC system permease protein LptF
MPLWHASDGLFCRHFVIANWLAVRTDAQRELILYESITETPPSKKQAPFWLEEDVFEYLREIGQRLLLL